MNVLHLWALLAGVVALGVPLAVHWLTRPRPVKVKLSTLRFVQESVKQRRARHRLRDALVLLARTVAIACLALAFARPLMRSATAQQQAGAVERVVVLDASASMGAVSNGVQAFERARGVAARYLEESGGLRANLVLAGARPRPVFERPSSNLRALREELGTAQVRSEKLDLSGVLAAAAETFTPVAANAAAPRREVVIISDLQRSNWGAADFSVLPKDARITVEAVAPAEQPENLAITDLRVRGRAVTGAESAAVPLSVEVANYGRSPRMARVHVQIDGKSYTLEKTCPGGTRTRLSGEVTFTTRGCVTGEAELDPGGPDALALDNRRAFVVEVRAAPTYLLVTREGAEPRPTPSHYLERALVPQAAPAEGGAAASGGGGGGADARPRERVLRVNAGAMDPQALAESDAVVLDRPGRLDGQAIALLVNSLRRGKSILYVAADPVDAINLKAIALQAGGDLRMPVEFLPPAGLEAVAGARAAGTAARGGGIRRNLTLAEVRQSDPVWAVFGDALRPTIESLRFTASLSSRPLEGGIADDILATYSDRSAFLVATACGQGTLVVMNADLADSTLVSSAAFVPLMGEPSGRLLAARPSATLDGGEPIALPLPANAGKAEDLTVIPPGSGGGGGGAGGGDDPAQRGRILEEHGGLVWRLDAASGGGRMGLYRILRGSQLVAAAAVGTPADESDLASLPKDTLTGRLAGSREITVHSTAADREGPDRAWVWLAGAAAVALMIEAMLLRSFRT